jgi:hypothetical protein
VERDFSELADSTSQDMAYVVKTGEILIQDKGVLDTGLTATHKIGTGEPLWFAEVISKRSKTLDFTNIGDVSLCEIKGPDIRQHVDKAGFLSKEIIRYSLARIYGRVDARRNFAFEDTLYRKRSEVDRVDFSRETTIFSWGDSSDAIYFIIDGQVSLRTIKNKKLVLLGSADSFGESSLITNKPRSLRAVAEADCKLFRMNSDWVLRYLEQEHPFVRLAVHQTLSMLSIRNQISLIKSNDGVYLAGAETSY